MKKVSLFVLTISLAAMLISGCAQTQSSTSSAALPAPDATEVASDIATMLVYSTNVDNTATSLASEILGVQVMATSAPTYTDGWWNVTYTAGTISYVYKLKAYTVTGAEIVSAPTFSLANRLLIALNLTIGETVSLTYGTESNPLIFDGMISGTKNINGPITLSATDTEGKSFSVSLTYSGIELNGSGYPASGSVNFDFSSSEYAPVAGTIEFSGATASLAYTSPSELTGTTYIIDLTDGSVSVASL